MESPSRRTFLKNGIAAVVAGPSLMQSHPRSIASLLSASSSPESENGSWPASTNVPDAEYPRIDDHRRVHFRIKAPDAKRVQIMVVGGGGETPRMDLVKQASGEWTLTTPPIVPGFHYYPVYLDGFEVTDPGSHTFFGYGRDMSGIEVPSPGETFTKFRMCPTEKCGSILITPLSRGRGAGFLFIHHLAMTSRQRRDIRCSISSTARGKTRRDGHGRAGRI